MSSSEPKTEVRDKTLTEPVQVGALADPEVVAQVPTFLLRREQFMLLMQGGRSGLKDLSVNLLAGAIASLLPVLLKLIRAFFTDRPVNIETVDYLPPFILAAITVLLYWFSKRAPSERQDLVQQIDHHLKTKPITHKLKQR
jgi:hypothetical protein